MANPLSLWRGFLARPNDDRVKVFGVALLTALASALVVSDALETRLVDLETGTFVDGTDAEAFDMAAAETDPEMSIAIPSEADIARIGRRSTLAKVHLLERDGDVLLIVLPIVGKGYQSTIRATLALEADLKTVAALTITEQGDTPGLGARGALRGRQHAALLAGRSRIRAASRPARGGGGLRWRVRSTI